MKIRNCARALFINEENKILLQRFEFPQVNGNKVLWVTPGGGVEENEKYEEALERELYEELGINMKIEGEPALVLDVPIDGKKGAFISHEVYYLVNFTADMNISLSNMTENEKHTFKGMKWWSKEELLQEKSDEYAPAEILNFL
ncbi:NUDIX domain-containing protein [Wukongibacter baidiensis]|uniref:NUDIX hydrolase n=1 Tax=Wukongibacter baidiensis TaxID=1723361 RepID=UPI003D7FD345